MKVIWGRNNHWISWLIQFRTWGEWSHCGVIIDNTVIEARGVPVIEYLRHVILGHKLTSKHGVLITPLDEFKDRYKHTTIRWMDGDETRAVELLGRPFDMGALFGAFLHQEWHDLDADMCAELVFYCLNNVEQQFAHKINPMTLFWFSRKLKRSEM